MALELAPLNTNAEEKNVKLHLKYSFFVLWVVLCWLTLINSSLLRVVSWFNCHDNEPTAKCLLIRPQDLYFWLYLTHLSWVLCQDEQWHNLKWKQICLAKTYNITTKGRGVRVSHAENKKLVALSSKN